MRYKRVILKFSGEVLKSSEQGGPIDYQVVKQLSSVLFNLHQNGLEIGVVLGGGNIFRGLKASKYEKYDRVYGDHMGMLATVINCLALKNCLDSLNIQSRLYSSLMMPDVCEHYTVRSALHDISDKKIVLLAGGTGKAFFSTDSAAALHANELRADIVLKATKVDGVYNKDPEKYDDAKKFDKISFADVLTNQLNVMDSTAFALCMDNNIPILVVKASGDNMLNIELALQGQPIGTLVGKFDQ